MDQLALRGAAAQEALPALSECFRDRRIEIHDAAERALLALGDPGVEALGALLSDGDSWVRCRAAAGLVAAGPRAAPALPELIGALDDHDYCVAEKSAEALGGLGEPAVPALLAALQSPQDPVSRGAAAALSRMGPEVQRRAAEVFLPGLKSRDEFLRGETAMKVSAMGKVGAPVFLAVINDPDVDLRRRAVIGLEEIGDTRPEVVDALVSLFNDPERTLRIKSAIVIGKFGRRDPAVQRQIAPRLNDADANIRRGAIQALGNMGSVGERSLEALVEIMEKSPDPVLREEAAEALMKIGTTASLAAAERHTRARSAPSP
jgi:HEAT repeat protein